VESPFGGVEIHGATVMVTVRYGREPVFRVDAGGAPTRVRSLLALASPSMPGERREIVLPAGHLEVSVVAGEASWWVGERRGRILAGETIRFGPESVETTVPAGDLGDWVTRPLGPVSEPDMMLSRAADPLEVLKRDLAAASVLVRCDAAERLGRLCGVAGAAEAVAERLVVEDDAVVLRALLDALRRLDARDRVEAARPGLRDLRPEVREAALRCWLDLRGAEGIPEVGWMINDPEPELRVLALRGLRALADPGARPWALKALEDPDPSVQAEARAVLEGL
jgi:hypothetical protein